MFLQQGAEVAADAQLGHVAVIEAQGDGAVVGGLDDEVRHNLLYVLADGFAHGGAWTGIEAANLADGTVGRVLVDVQLLLYLVPMLAGELFVTVGHNVFLHLQ